MIAPLQRGRHHTLEGKRLKRPHFGRSTPYLVASPTSRDLTDRNQPSSGRSLDKRGREHPWAKAQLSFALAQPMLSLSPYSRSARTSSHWTQHARSPPSLTRPTCSTGLKLTRPLLSLVRTAIARPTQGPRTLEGRPTRAPPRLTPPTIIPTIIRLTTPTMRRAYRTLDATAVTTVAVETSTTKTATTWWDTLAEA